MAFPEDLVSRHVLLDNQEHVYWGGSHLPHLASDPVGWAYPLPLDTDTQSSTPAQPYPRTPKSASRGDRREATPKVCSEGERCERLSSRGK